MKPSSKFRKLPDELWSVSPRGETESQPVKISETVETAQIPQSDEQITVSEEVKTDRVKSKPSKSFADLRRAMKQPKKKGQPLQASPKQSQPSI